MQVKYNCCKPTYLLPIRCMQEYLWYISKNIYEIIRVIPDGIFGETTKEAVLSFQKYFDLPETGAIDYQTWEMIVFVYQQLKTAKQNSA